MKCRKCGQDLKRLMILALMQEFGARCYPGADVCSEDGGEHDFTNPKDDVAKEQPYA